MIWQIFKIIYGLNYVKNKQKWNIVYHKNDENKQKNIVAGYIVPQSNTKGHVFILSKVIWIVNTII